ncbi:MAG: xanthine dehydrogenase accessory protein XdhC [Geminicoccaceae bacterium]
MSGLAALLEKLLAAGRPAVLVTIVASRGSVPREVGARMLVHAAGSAGTVGGGELEWRAIARAKTMLESGEREVLLELVLGPELGQCCGGRATLRLERADARLLERLDAAEEAERAARPRVLLFGAGHVGRALARVLAPLPLRIGWIDPRPDVFPADLPAGIELLPEARPVRLLEEAAEVAAVLVVTHSHALDFALVAAALARDDPAYVGLIGSASKRARFLSGLRALGLAEARIARLVCPIGGTTADKRPEVVALLAAAELWRAVAEKARPAA